MASLLESLKSSNSTPENTSEIDGEIPIWDEGLEPDPAPGELKKAPRKLLKQTTSGSITPAMKKRIAAELEAYIEFAAIPVMMRDPHCGGVLHEQARQVADAIATILSRYPDLAHKFLATGVLGDWMKLLAVLQPIASAIWQHHIVKPKDQATEQQEQQDVIANYPAYRAGA